MRWNFHRKKRTYLPCSKIGYCGAVKQEDALVPIMLLSLSGQWDHQNLLEPIALIIERCQAGSNEG